MPDDSSATAYPIVIAEWQRNSREAIRIALDQYKGRDIVDARAWRRNEDGNWRPGRNGLTLSLKHLPSLAEGLGDAVRRARQLGIIEGVEYRPKDRTAAERQRRYRQRRNGRRDGVTVCACALLHRHIASPPIGPILGLTSPLSRGAIT